MYVYLSLASPFTESKKMSGFVKQRDFRQIN